MEAGRRALFLDRDGVINRSIVRGGRPYAPVSLQELEILPAVAEALLRTRAAGFLNVVVTNQPDIATGKQQLAVLRHMHAFMMAELAIDSIKVCTHLDADGCACRKPNPGLLLDAAREMNIDLSASFMVGDRWSDVAAGQRAGCTSFFIDHGYAEKRPEHPYITAGSLLEVAELMVRQAHRTTKHSTSSRLPSEI